MGVRFLVPPHHRLGNATYSKRTENANSLELHHYVGRPWLLLTTLPVCHQQWTISSSRQQSMRTTRSAKVGMKLNAKKWKLLKLNTKCRRSWQLHIPWRQCHQNRGSMADIKKRIAMAGKSFRWLHNIWKATDIGRNTKVALFKSLVLSILLYIWMWDLEANQDRGKEDSTLEDSKDKMAATYP